MRRTDAVAVFGLALAVRLALVAFSSGGFTGNYGYDASVYYAASDALTHGRLPYADFVLLHPPGLMLVLTPFAIVGRLTTDHIGFIVANMAFTAIGALNAALVTRIADRWGLTRRAALLGGIFYAVWLGAAAPEISARLEPLGTLAFLFGVLLLSAPRPATLRVTIAAGAALGFAAAVKIWWIVPLLVLVGWHWFAAHDRRAASRLLFGAAASLTLVLGPFFAVAPGPMWRMIITDQLGRHSVHTSQAWRIVNLSSLGHVVTGDPARIVLSVVLVVVALAVAAVAWRQRPARPIVLVAVAQILVLLASPSYFAYYSGYPASAIALVLAAAAQRPAPRIAGSCLPRLRGPIASARVAPLTAVVVATAAIVTAAALATSSGVVTPTPLQVDRLRSAVGSLSCVTADSPMALIALDSLSRGLASGCPNWVDVSGRTYNVDAETEHGNAVPRTKNTRWQRDIRRYLLSGQAVIVIRRDTGLSSATRAAIRSLPVLDRSHGFTVYRVEPSRRGTSSG